MSTTALSNGLGNLHSAMDARGRNIVQGNVVGGFGKEIQFVATESGSKYQERSTLSYRGDAISTGNESDLAIESGFFIVKGTDGALRCTANGSFRRGKDEKFYLGDGCCAMGVMYTGGVDASTSIASTSSLVPLTLRGVTSMAVATKKVSLHANLNRSALALKGPGGQMNIAKNKVSSAVGINDVIAPGDTNAGALHLGDQFILTPSQPGAPVTFEYGGIGVTKKVSTANPIFSSTRADSAFTIAAATTPAAAGILVHGEGLKITVGGAKSYTFTASSQSAATGQKLFNSLSSLASAINSTPGLRARIGDINNDPRLYISAEDADSSLTFDNTPGASIVETLGLDPVPAAANGIKRFATMNELKQKINVTPGLTASLDGSNNLEFGTESALSTLGLNGRAKNERQVYRAFSTKLDTALDAGRSWDKDNIFSIGCNNHGLKAGDFVRLSGTQQLNTGAAGIANSLVDGVYQVLFTKDDSFSLATGASLVIGAGNAAVADLFNGNPPANMKWQKVDGESIKDIIPNGNSVVAALGATVSFTTSAGFGTKCRLAVGDSVYIQNSATLKDGVYIVNAVNNGADTVTVSVANVAAGQDYTVAGDAVVAAGGGVPENATIITKIASGGTIAPANRLDPMPLTIVANSANVTISTPGHNYHIGDIIAFRELITDIVTFNNLSITKNKYYTITSTTPDTITFSADSVANNNGSIGFLNTRNNAGALANAAGTVLGPNAYIDYISREYAALGVTIGEGGSAVSESQLSNGLAVTYDPNNAALNFSNGNVTKNTWNMPLTVIGSQGTVHDLFLTAGKVTDNKWAIEIYSKEKDDGTYEVVSNIGGQLASGYIEFDGQGQLMSVDANLQNLTINWVGGEVSSNVKIDWGAIGGIGGDGKPAPAGIVQLDKASNDEGAVQDGKVPGNVIGYYFDENGTLHARCGNGENIEVGKLILAKFPNVNDLIQKDGYYYESSKSGTMLLKAAGTGGLSEIKVGSLTSSNGDETNEYLLLTEESLQTNLIVNVIDKKMKAEEFMRNRL